MAVALAGYPWILLQTRAWGSPALPNHVEKLHLLLSYRLGGLSVPFGSVHLSFAIASSHDMLSKRRLMCAYRSAADPCPRELRKGC